MSRTHKDTPKVKKNWRYIRRGRGVGHDVKEEMRLRKGALKKIELPTKGNHYKKVLVDRWSYD